MWFQFCFFGSSDKLIFIEPYPLTLLVLYGTSVYGTFVFYAFHVLTSYALYGSQNVDREHLQLLDLLVGRSRCRILFNEKPEYVFRGRPSPLQR